jgi:hypothetical protein
MYGLVLFPAFYGNKMMSIQIFLQDGITMFLSVLIDKDRNRGIVAVLQELPEIIQAMMPVVYYGFGWCLHLKWSELQIYEILVIEPSKIFYGLII